MLSAASSLAWIAGHPRPHEDIDGLVAEAEAFARSQDNVVAAPIFLPYLSGERTPYNDPAATGLFAGLRAEHGADALAFAVMEGVAFSFADGVDVIDEAGAKPIRPMIVGGGARSFWAQMIADATGLTIDLAPAPKPARRSAPPASPCWRPAPATRRRSARGRRCSANSSPTQPGRPSTPRVCDAIGRCTARKRRRGKNFLPRI